MKKLMFLAVFGLMMGSTVFGQVYDQGNYVGIRTNSSLDRPLVIKGNGGNSELITFRNENDYPRWHLNLNSGGLNFAETGVLDFRFFIQNGGNIGIGTGNPTEKLQIGDRWTFHDGGTKYIGYNSRFTGGKNIRLVNGKAGQLKFHDGSFDFYGDNNSLAAGDSITTSQLMTINYNGNVGIGTHNISNLESTANAGFYRLYVKGGIKAEEVKVELASANGWADYVFADDYNLLSLKDVENHIETEGHLHNTPSAEELAETGLELKSITVNQQEKIEELYLHMIEMNKRLEALEKENKALKAKLN